MKQESEEMFIMRKWKKITAGILSACLAASCVPGVSGMGEFVHTKTMVQAAEKEAVLSGTWGDTITWKYDWNTKVLTIGGVGKTDSYDYGKEWISYKNEIKKIIIEDQVSEIGNGAFMDCTSVEQVQFGNGVKKIGNCAFEGCKSLKSVELGGNIEKIGASAFAFCENLTDVSVGQSLTSVGDDIFEGCNALCNIRVDEGNKNLLVQENRLRSIQISGKFGANTGFIYDTPTKTLTVSGTGIFQMDPDTTDVCTGYFEDGYFNAEDNLFWEYSPYRKTIMEEMERLVIGDGITKIEMGAFANCKSLREVELGKDVTDLEKGVFCGCTALQQINWTDKIEKIGGYCFYSCKNLEHLYVGQSLKEIADTAFAGCSNLKQIEVHNENLNYSKQGNNLLNKEQTKWILGCFASDSTCHIGDHVTYLNPETAILEKIDKFEVSSNNNTFSSENGLLYSKDGKTLYLCPRGKKGAVTVNDKTTKIDKLGTYAVFADCQNIETIAIGKNVKALNYCFSGCSNLKQVNISGKNKYFASENRAILSKNMKKLICCISTKNGTYHVPKKVTAIANHAFEYCNNLKNVVLSDDIKFVTSSIMTNAKIESITLGKNYCNGNKFAWAARLANLKNIYVSKKNPYYSASNGVLYDKKKKKVLLYPKAKDTSVYKMPNTVTSVGKHAFFDDNSAIKELYVSDEMKDLTDLPKESYIGLMDGLTELEILHIGKKVKKLSLVEPLEQYKVNPKNQTYGSKEGILYTKKGDRLIRCPIKKQGKVFIPNGTKVIGKGAFYGCNKVTDVVIPGSVKSIEKEAFGSEGNREKMDFVVWVPAGKLEVYEKLLTKETGFWDGMVVKEMEH